MPRSAKVLSVTLRAQVRLGLSFHQFWTKVAAENRGPADIVCPQCGFIIATLREKRA